MKTKNLRLDFYKRFSTLLMALALVVGLLGLPQGAVQASAPTGPTLRQAQGPALAATQSTLSGLNCSTACDLYAKAGTLSLPGAVTVPVWGFSDTPGGAAQYPGPTIIATSGDTLNITLHNVDVPGSVSLDLPYLPRVPDMTGVAAGGSKTYAFLVADAGTYLYQAGLTADGPRQVTMGLFGALIVRPAGQPAWAYNDAATAFDDEALVIISEIDPAFNAAPLTFNLTTFSPKYFLVNGKVFPDTALIEAHVGKRLLLRQINAGVQQRAIAVMGLRQTVVGLDAAKHPYSYKMTSETIYAGQALDTLVTIPAAAPLGTKYALYDAGRHFTNGTQAGFNGQVTFIQVADGLAATSGGPLAINVSISPNPTNGITGGTLSATITDIFSGNQNITQAEYFIDTLGAPGTGTPMSGTFGAPSVNVSVAISAGTLAALPGGEHVFYVRGLDADSKWGLVGSAALNLDKLGPQTLTFSLTPHMTNGSTPLDLHAYVDDTMRGGATIVAGEYFLDTVGVDGSGVPLTLAAGGQIATTIGTTIATTTVLGMSQGLHVIYVHGQDSFGNWGTFGTGTLTVDFTGPLGSGVNITPALLDLSGPPPVTSVRIDATLTDALLYVDRSEAFFDTFTGNGTGFQLVPADGLMDELVEAVYFNVPVGQIAYFSQGVHTLYVHGRDAAGNWGVLATDTITINKGVALDVVAPNIIALNYNATMLRPAAGPAATAGVQINLLARASDPNYISNIAAAEWFIGTAVPANPADRHPMVASDGFGLNNYTIEDLSAAIDTSSFSGGGMYTFSVRAQDSAGNWGPVVSLTINLDAPFQIFMPSVQR
ncbi:MAG TPA: multicopper oxidase domain-containing protein [Anaerolineaceae bacterium]|nr:multicopper oxidase domain-containing protein [Anaerolineaceae bacterium]